MNDRLVLKTLADLNDRLFSSLALGSLCGSLALTALILLFVDGLRGFLIVIGVYFVLLGGSYLIGLVTRNL